MVRDAVSLRFAALLVGSGKLGVKSIDKEHQIAHRNCTLAGEFLIFAPDNYSNLQLQWINGSKLQSILNWGFTLPANYGYIFIWIIFESFATSATFYSWQESCFSHSTEPTDHLCTSIATTATNKCLISAGEMCFRRVACVCADFGCGRIRLCAVRLDHRKSNRAWDAAEIVISRSHDDQFSFLPNAINDVSILLLASEWVLSRLAHRQHSQAPTKYTSVLLLVRWWYMWWLCTERAME